MPVDVSNRMAEFEAIVKASFDNIGSHVVALDNIHSTTTTTQPLHPPTDKTTPPRSPVSFLRKVKSHATSLLFSQTRQVSLPPATPAPFSSNSFPTRASTKSLHTPDLSDFESKRSFFDNDNDDDIDDVVDRPVFPPTRRSRRFASAPARPDSRLSSTSALFGFPSSSVSIRRSIVEQHDIPSANSRAGPARVCTHLALNLFSPLCLCCSISSHTDHPYWGSSFLQSSLPQS